MHGCRPILRPRPRPTLADRAQHVAGADVRVLAPPDAVRAGPANEREELAGLRDVTSVGGLHRELRFVDDVAVELVVADVQEAALAPLVVHSGRPRAT